MFDIGFQELMLIFVVGLLVLGPERLPTAIRTVSHMLGRMRASYNSIRAEIEREVGAEELKQDLHNQGVLDSLRETGEELKQAMDNTRGEMEQFERQINTEMTGLEDSVKSAQTGKVEPANPDDAHEQVPLANSGKPQAAP